MALRERPRIELREHGLSQDMLSGLDLAREAVLDLSTGGNRYGPPPGLLETLRAALGASYPDPAARRAREAIAGKLGTTPERILLGSGATDLLWTCGRALVQAGDAVLSVMPGYTELASAARASGARVVQWRAVERTGHAVDLAQVAELMLLERPALVDLCAPASPSGAPVPFANVMALALRFADTLFVVDQAELALTEQHAELSCAPAANVLCVRSLGKELGLTSVRAGYLWASQELCSHLERRRPSLAVSGLVQAMAEAATHEASFMAESRARLLQDRARLARLVAELGLTATPSVTPSLLVRMARAREVAEDLLCLHGVAVRDCTAYGLPDHLRIGGISATEEPRLRDALGEVLARRGLSAGRET